MQLVLATANEGKIREIASILSDLRISFLSIASLGGYIPPIESGATYAENAATKAKAAAELSGNWALADDSGLEVEALGGQPGVHSNRYLGPTATDRERNQRILELLMASPPGTWRCFGSTIHSPSGSSTARRCAGQRSLPPA